MICQQAPVSVCEQLLQILWPEQGLDSNVTFLYVSGGGRGARERCLQSACSCRFNRKCDISLHRVAVDTSSRFPGVTSTW